MGRRAVWEPGLDGDSRLLFQKVGKKTMAGAWLAGWEFRGWIALNREFARRKYSDNYSAVIFP
jgi:hypothetical protein